MPEAGPKRDRLKVRIATAASISVVIGVIAALTTGSYWFGAGIALAAAWIVWRSAILGTDKVEGEDTSLSAFMRDTDHS
jgi:hypothetical protein